MRSCQIAWVFRRDTIVILIMPLVLIDLFLLCNVWSRPSGILSDIIRLLLWQSASKTNMHQLNLEILCRAVIEWFLQGCRPGRYPGARFWANYWWCRDDIRVYVENVKHPFEEPFRAVWADTLERGVLSALQKSSKINP